MLEAINGVSISNINVLIASCFEASTVLNSLTGLPVSTFTKFASVVMKFSEKSVLVKEPFFLNPVSGLLLIFDVDVQFPHKFLAGEEYHFKILIAPHFVGNWTTEIRFQFTKHIIDRSVGFNIYNTKASMTYTPVSFLDDGSVFVSDFQNNILSHFGITQPSAKTRILIDATESNQVFTIPIFLYCSGKKNVLMCKPKFKPEVTGLELLPVTNFSYPARFSISRKSNGGGSSARM
ncbi:hypothetical protein HK096_001072, partial [Nowakowskiella sp. JEL0078]